MPSASAIIYTPFDELDDRFTNAHRFGRPRRPEVLLLRPNQKALLLLCPLLPPSPTNADGQSVKSKRLRLPAEAWQRVLAFAMDAEDDDKSSRGPSDLGKVRYLLICKSFQVSWRRYCDPKAGELTTSSAEPGYASTIFVRPDLYSTRARIIREYSCYCRREMGLDQTYSIFDARPLGSESIFGTTSPLFVTCGRFQPYPCTSCASIPYQP